MVASFLLFFPMVISKPYLGLLLYKNFKFLEKRANVFQLK